MTLPNGILLTYGYDNDSRITGITYTLGTTAVGSLTYQYDAAGRRTQMGGSLAATGFPQATTLAAYDVANELTNWNGTTITPDANGNILNDGVAAYTWNGRNELISRGSTSFQYDSYGRRSLNAAGNNLLYEGWSAGQELSGTTPVANRILGGIDEFFNRTDSTGTYSPITNALGSVLALANSSGNITTQYGYDPYGNTTSSGGTSTNVFEYTGRENDADGLYFYRARYYSPQFGRFISEDPLGFGGGNVNLYGYAFGSPANLIDPFGLSSGGGYGGGGGSGMAGRSCGCGGNPFTAPPAPLGTSVDFNIMLTQYAMNDIGGDYTGTQLAWFYNMVNTSGPWDYKQQGDQYTDFGNFNYGATCGAIGWPLYFCQGAAGLAHDYRAFNLGLPLGNGIPYLIPPYGDQAADQDQIANGYYYQIWKQLLPCGK